MLIYRYRMYIDVADVLKTPLEPELGFTVLIRLFIHVLNPDDLSALVFRLSWPYRVFEASAQFQPFSQPRPLGFCQPKLQVVSASKNCVFHLNSANNFI